MAKLFRHHPERWFFFALLTILIVGHGGAASAANLPATTQISDTLYRADGSAASGTLLISWPAFTTADKQTVAAGTKSVAVGADGTISVSLVPTEGAVPATLYKVVMKLDDGTSSVEYWNVPGTPTAKLAVIRTAPATQPSAAAFQATVANKLDRQGDTPVTLAGLRFASKFAGNTVQNQIGSAMSACTDPGCVVVVPSDMGAGAPGAIPDNVRIMDMRGLNGPDETGNETANWKNNILFRGRWSAPQPTVTGYQVMHLHSEAAAGGHNYWNSTEGFVKATYSGLLGTHVGRTPGQHLWGYVNNNNYSDGDTVGLFSNAKRWGNTSANGDEGIEAISGTVSGGDATLTATITSISGNTLYYGSAANEYTRGENRIVINTKAAKVYSTGTVTGIAQYASPAVVTFSGTALGTQFGTGTKTNLCFALDADQINGIKRVFPIASIDSATQATLTITAQGNAAGWGTSAPTTGTYKIYKCSTSTTASAAGQMGVADASVFAAGDTIEQVVGYAQSMMGAHFALFPTINATTLGSMGAYIVNNGQAQSGTSSNKIRLDRGMFVTGPWSKGIVVDGDVSDSAINFYNPKQGSVGLAVDDIVANDTANLVSAMRNDLSRSYFSYNKATDNFCFGGYTFGLCKFQIKPDDGSATMSKATITGTATVGALNTNILMGDQQSGSDICAKINSCSSALASSGGVCDFRAYTGVQQCAAHASLNGAHDIDFLFSPAVTIQASTSFPTGDELIYLAGAMSNVRVLGGNWDGNNRAAYCAYGNFDGSQSMSLTRFVFSPTSCLNATKHGLSLQQVNSTGYLLTNISVKGGYYHDLGGAAINLSLVRDVDISDNLTYNTGTNASAGVGGSNVIRALGGRIKIANNGVKKWNPLHDTAGGPSGGIYVGMSSDVIITGNTVAEAALSGSASTGDHGAVGIYCDTCDSGTITGNTIRDGGTGIRTEVSQNMTVSGNTITAVGDFGILPDSRIDQVQRNSLDTTTGLVAPDPNVTLGTDSSDKQEGAASVTAAVGAAFAGGTILSQDLGSVQSWIIEPWTRLWLKSDTLLNYDQLELWLSATNNLANAHTKIPIPHIVANTWMPLRVIAPNFAWTLATWAGSTSGVRSWGIVATGPLGAAVNLKFDDLRSDVGVQNNTISNNAITRTGAAGIFLYGPVQFYNVTGNVIRGAGWMSNNPTSYATGIYVRTDTSSTMAMKNVSITGNTISGVPGNFVLTGSNTTAGLKIYASSTSTIDQVKLCNNDIDTATYTTATSATNISGNTTNVYYCGTLRGTQALTSGAATVSFSPALVAAPVCTCTDQTAAAAVKCSASTTALTIAGTGSDTIAYSCQAF